MTDSNDIFSSFTYIEGNIVYDGKNVILAHKVFFPKIPAIEGKLMPCNIKCVLLTAIFT